jgi:hypothetical protein
VLGAGNTAIDMAVQMARLGARDVNLVYRRGAADMGATGHEQDIAKANQVRLLTWAQPEEVLLDDQGQVRGMRFRTALVDGRLQTTGETFELAADAIFKAIGQGFDSSASRPAGPQLRRASGFASMTPAHQHPRRVCRRRLHQPRPGPHRAGGAARQAGRRSHHAQLMLNVEAA